MGGGKKKSPVDEDRAPLGKLDYQRFLTAVPREEEPELEPLLDEPELREDDPERTLLRDEEDPERLLEDVARREERFSDEGR
jgi:hypothetical protein